MFTAADVKALRDMTGAGMMDCKRAMVEADGNIDKAQEALREAVGLECDIRWPNDLMASNRKLGGILTQLERGNAITGIGINVNHLGFPAGIGDATSVRLELGQQTPVSREAIILALAPAIDLFTEMEQSEILRLFSHASSYAMGRSVTVQMPDGIIEGVTEGLDAAGFLKVRKNDGTTTLVLAGGVRATGA
jgi:BirA family biotin operon repressor/biotin-[acetyl-CoA-carboxylase] ligase